MMNFDGNWEKLWQELSAAQTDFWNSRKRGTGKGGDFWSKKKADGFQKMVAKRWAKPDSTRAFIAEQLKSHPGTVADIGAGTGAWTVFMAPYAKSVTAVEPSDAMRAALEENIATARLPNVSVIHEQWPQAQIEPHDYTLASHSLYGCQDLRAFVLAMTKATRRMCLLVLRMPLKSGIMATAARRIWGHPYDSPCFQVAYNALMQMGIYANVQMEHPVNWDGWTHASFDEALIETRSRFGLSADSPHESFLQSLLSAGLKKEDGKVVWPVETRSVLVYWKV